MSEKGINNSSPFQGVYRIKGKKERPISEVYAVIDNDLARDNLENDIPKADLEDI